MSKILKMLNKKVRKDNKGFTLVELLVVIAIIGILAAVAVPSLFSNMEKGKISALEADINAIKTQVLSDYSENSSTIPTTITANSLSEPFGEDSYTLNADGDLVVSGLGDLSDKGVAKVQNDLKVTIADDGTIIIKILSNDNATPEED